MSRRKNFGKSYDNLLAKIAAQLGEDEEKLKEIAKPDLYTEEDKALQRQSIINYYRSTRAAKEPTQATGETKLAFMQRLAEWHNARNEWKYRECEGCKQTFAYAYHYEGVKFCSLECLDAELRRIGIEITPGREPQKRWGLAHPAVVPASALASLQVLYPSDLNDASAG